MVNRYYTHWIGVLIVLMLMIIPSAQITGSDGENGNCTTQSRIDDVTSFREISTNQWKNSGAYGGFMLDMDISRSSPNVLYVAADTRGGLEYSAIFLKFSQLVYLYRVVITNPA